MGEAGKPLKVLDLFSGIGAYSLGLERTGGFQTVATCEIDAWCRANLKRKWTTAYAHDDVTTLTGEGLRAAGIVPDWIVGGWPCQGNSSAGTGLGMDDPRSGLWREIARLAGEIRPRGLLLENSSNLLNINEGRDFGRVLGDLASLGYDAEWHCLSAAAFDAPHIRDRVWIIATLADPDAGQCDDARQAVCAGRHAADDGSSTAHADAHGERAQIPPARRQSAVEVADVTGEARASSDPSGLGCEPRRPEPARVEGRPVFDGDDTPPNADRLAPIGTAIARQQRHTWEPEPDVVRVVSRRPAWLLGDRIDVPTPEGGTREILQVLRGEIPKADLRWPARGFEHLQTPKVLLDKVCILTGAPEPLGHVSLARSADEGIVLRSLWFHGKTACASCRRSADEQRSVEHPDTLRVLSQLLACDCGSAWLDPTGTAPSDFRVERIRALGNLNPPIIPESIGRAILSILQQDTA